MSKPTTSDIELILDAFGKTYVLANKQAELAKTAAGVSDAQRGANYAKQQALAAIEAHYEAIRRADMEYVADLHDDSPLSGNQINRLIRERLNNTEEQV